MGKGGERKRRGSLTPGQPAEGVSTGSLGFEDSLRRVMAGVTDDEHMQGETMGENSDVAERELTDEEVIAAWEEMTAGARDGTLRTFSDPASLREDIRRRFNL